MISGLGGGGGGVAFLAFVGELLCLFLISSVVVVFGSCLKSAVFSALKDVLLPSAVADLRLCRLVEAVVVLAEAAAAAVVKALLGRPANEELWGKANFGSAQ